MTPAATIKAALAARVIVDGDVWMRALDARNRMSHSYSQRAFERTVADIRALYLGVFEKLQLALASEKSTSKDA